SLTRFTLFLLIYPSSSLRLRRLLSPFKRLGYFTRSLWILRVVLLVAATGSLRANEPTLNLRLRSTRMTRSLSCCTTMQPENTKAQGKEPQKMLLLWTPLISEATDVGTTAESQTMKHFIVHQ